MQSGITELIVELRDGEAQAWDRLLPLVYDELRRVARRHVRRQGSAYTLNTTALVHEAYLKLADAGRMTYADRVHFFALASRAMRQVLIDYARRHQTMKRGGEWRRLDLQDAEIPAIERADELLALDDALTRLAAMNQRLARVVECRFFGGLTEGETATALGVNERTIRRDWTKARLWLYDALRPDAA
jgi:RNA polymerase sigma factor (TIGR02999 family)